MNAARRRLRLWWALALMGSLCLGATPGDIGGCGAAVRDLDGPAFFATKKVTDCEACRECGIVSRMCRTACDGEPPEVREFPQGCFPLTHDGVVCLRALMNAACDEYQSFMDDGNPQVPTECNFCSPEAMP